MNLSEQGGAASVCPTTQTTSNITVTGRSGHTVPLIPASAFADESPRHPANVAARIDGCTHAYISDDGTIPLTDFIVLDSQGWNIRFFGYANDRSFFMAYRAF